MMPLTKEQQILERQRQLAARMNNASSSNLSSSLSSSSPRFGPSVPHSDSTKNTSTNPSSMLFTNHLKTTNTPRSFGLPQHLGISGNNRDPTLHSNRGIGTNLGGNSSTCSNSNVSSKTVYSMTGQKKVIEITKVNTTTKSSKSTSSKASSSSTVGSSHSNKQTGTTNSFSTNSSTRDNSSSLQNRSTPDSTSTSTSTNETPSSSISDTGPSAIKRPTLKRPSTKAASTAALLAAARAKAEGDSAHKPSTSLAKRTTAIDELKGTTDPPQSPVLKRKKIETGASSTDPSGGVASSNASSTTTKTSSLASLVARHVKSSLNDDDDDGSSLPTHSPDDFWKNIREWDLVSDFNTQHRQQLKQQQQQQKLNQQRAMERYKNSNNNNGNSGSSRENGNDDDAEDDDNDTLAKKPNVPAGGGGGRRPLPDTFLNARHYIAAWAPLCLAECRAQLMQEFIQNMPKGVLCTVETKSDGSNGKGGGGVGGGRGGRGRDRDTSHYFGGMDAPWLEENETGMYIVLHPAKDQFIPKEYQNFMANDLFLLVTVKYQNVILQITQNNPPMTVNGRDLDDFNAYSGVSMVGHVEYSRRDLNGLTLKVSRRKWAVVGKNEMYLFKIGSNVTALREFTALCGVETLPMKSFLLGQQYDPHNKNNKLKNNPFHQHHKASKNGSTSSNEDDTDSADLLQMLGGSEKLGNGFIEYAKKKFNSSQLTAIAASAYEYGEGGFTLIKGPPGTGKTTTLVAVLNSLHIRQYNKYYEEVRRIATKQTGSREHALAMARRAKPRLLVCAPSNAAIDNIILKIMDDGFVDGQGRKYFPSMIRVGVGQSNAVRAVALETKVDTIFSENMDIGKLQNSISCYQSELTRISQDIANLRRRLTAIELALPWPCSRDWEIRIDDEAFDQTGLVYFVNHKEKITTYEKPPPPEPGQTQFPATSMPEYRSYVARVVKLVENYFSVKTELERCSIVKSSLENGANQIDVRMNLETHVLNSMHMVMTTLGTAGNRTLEASDKFEVIVVDEAAQSVEPACLSALKLGSRHAVLVGDPQQLPATIFNVTGRNSKYDRSLFQRLEEAGQPIYMLNEQYRMHPNISHFPRHIFYGGALMDGPNVVKPEYGNPLRELICTNVPNFQPLMILDLDSKEERGGTSLSNASEAKLAVHLYQQLKIVTNGASTSTKVAVISPYAQQTKLLRRIFSDVLGPNYESLVEVNTVDAFQGREANIVIFSAVRAAGSKGIGFLSDVRRMNVALTRAKYFLFIIARIESIVVNPYWNDLVEHARDTNAVVRVPMSGYNNNKKFNNVMFGDIRDWQLEHPASNNNDSNSVNNDRNNNSNNDRSKNNLFTTRQRPPPPPPPTRQLQNPSHSSGPPPPPPPRTDSFYVPTMSTNGGYFHSAPPPPPPPPPFSSSQTMIQIPSLPQTFMTQHQQSSYPPQPPSSNQSMMTMLYYDDQQQQNLISIQDPTVYIMSHPPIPPPPPPPGPPRGYNLQ